MVYGIDMNKMLKEKQITSSSKDSLISTNSERRDSGVPISPIKAPSPPQPLSKTDSFVAERWKMCTNSFNDNDEQIPLPDFNYDRKSSKSSLHFGKLSSKTDSRRCIEVVDRRTRVNNSPERTVNGFRAASAPIDRNPSFGDSSVAPFKSTDSKYSVPASPKDQAPQITLVSSNSQSSNSSSSPLYENVMDGSRWRKKSESIEPQLRNNTVFDWLGQHVSRKVASKPPRIPINDWLPPVPKKSTRGSAKECSLTEDINSDTEESVYLPPTDMNGLTMPLFAKVNAPASPNASKIDEISTVLNECLTAQQAEIRRPTLLYLAQSQHEFNDVTPTNRVQPNLQKTLQSIKSPYFDNDDEVEEYNDGDNGNYEVREDHVVVAHKWSEQLQKSMNRAARRKVLVAGKTLFNSQPQKGIDYLIKSGIIANNPSTIAKFLITDNLSCQAIGEYFGRLSDPLAVKVAREYINNLELKSLEIDQALRYMLWRIHPEGESQKIEFLLVSFKESYTRQNPEKVKENFKHPDTLIIVAYSIMMLHTDLYNPNVRRHARCMTADGFVANHRGIDDGHDLNSDFLRGIYDRVSAHEFKSISDLTDKLREIDQLLMGPLKFDRFVERHRRFVAWTAGFEVIDVTAKRPLISRTNSQLRGIFIFNDLLIIAKPTRSYAVDALLGIQPSSLVDNAVNTHRRFRSLDRFSIRVTSPTSFTDSSSVVSNGSSYSNTARKRTRNSQNPSGICSTKVPTNCPLLIKYVIPVENVQILVFESEHYKFGVQLRDETNLLINLNLPSGEIRRKFIDWLYGSIEETKEVLRVQAEIK